MPGLVPQQLDRRLRVDEHTAALINIDPAPIQVTAHHTALDARRGCAPIPPRSTSRPPEHYRVVFDFDTLIAADVRHRPTAVHIDLLANGNYPFTEPICRVIGDKIPWTPHFDPAWPICIGGGWSRTGSHLLVDLIVHIARLLNFDEPPPSAGYHGYNAAAIEWWTANGCRPLDPALRYPIVDPNAATGAAGDRFASASDASRPPAAAGSTRFAPAAAAERQPRMRPASGAVPRPRFAPLLPPPQAGPATHRTPLP